MVQRRDILKTSLTLCSSAAYRAVGIGAGAADARAEGPTSISGVGYELWFIGAQRETIMNGKLAAALDLNTLAGRTHLYGLGPQRAHQVMRLALPRLPRVLAEPDAHPFTVLRGGVEQ